MTRLPRNSAELDQIRVSARQMLQQHGLGHWRFDFDRARVRAGSCRFQSRLITMSREFARRASQQDVQDTLLHEIAHALAGAKAGHGPLWRAQALAIGCSGRRCHAVQFTPPRYHVYCANRCFRATAHRRRRHVVCRRCRGQVIYEECDQDLPQSDAGYAT